MPTPDEATLTRRAIEAAEQRFMLAARRGSAADMAAVFTEDAAVLGFPDARGRAQIEAAFDALLRSVRLVEIQLVPAEIEVHGDTAWEVGSSLFAFELDGKHVSQWRRYLMVWRRENGRWLIHRDLAGEPAPVAR